MTKNIMKPSTYVISSAVKNALKNSLPIVALESTVLTHGLPRPQNHALARGMEQAIHDEGVTPATIAILEGKIHIGLSEEELERLSAQTVARKVSPRDMAIALHKNEYGGTTVAGTIYLANTLGMKVFATGGIGGVHSLATMDISADLSTLSETPMIVVCAGAKAILDLPATVEYLETAGIPVVGYRTNQVPAFYSPDSGLPVDIRLETPNEVVNFAKTHWSLGLKSAILVCQPAPRGNTIPRTEIENLIRKASLEASKKGIIGSALTPFMLQRLSEMTGGETLRTNLALLLNNACLAAQIAKTMYSNVKKA
jgi:pseudouridylate synthase